VDDVALMPVVDAAPNVETMGMSMAGKPLRDHSMVILGLVYPLENFHIDPENSLILMETNLPTPMTARVYVNLPEGKGKLNPERKAPYVMGKSMVSG